MIERAPRAVARGARGPPEAFGRGRRWVSRVGLRTGGVEGGAKDGGEGRCGDGGGGEPDEPSCNHEPGAEAVVS